MNYIEFRLHSQKRCHSIDNLRNKHAVRGAGFQRLTPNLGFTPKKFVIHKRNFLSRAVNGERASLSVYNGGYLRDRYRFDCDSFRHFAAVKLIILRTSLHNFGPFVVHANSNV